MSDGPKGSTIGGGIVPAGSRLEGSGGRGSLPTLVSVLVCALGGFVSTTSLSIAAPGLVAFGLVSSARRARDLVPGVLAAVAVSLALGVVTGMGIALDGVVICLGAAAVALALVTGRLTAGSICLVVAAVGICHLGVDAALSALGGTTLTETVASMLAYLREQFVEVSPAAAEQVDAILSAVGLMWPTAYVVTGLLETVVALLGARVSASEERRPGLSGFDLPLWVVTALVVAVAGLAVSLTVPDAPDVLLMVSANMAMALRFAFLAQGAGVISWFFREKNVGALARAAVTVAALYCEVQFVVVSIVGLVDVWANFRKLERGSGPSQASAAEQDKEPAQAG